MRVLALLSGGVLALAFPAPGAWWLAWVGLVPLLLMCGLARSRAEALLRSSLTAIGFFLTYFNWLLPQVGLLAVAVAVVAGLVWLPVGLAAHLLLRREPSAARVALAVLVLPSVWVSVEGVRSWEHLGGAWALLGLSQWQVRPVLALASLGGVWLLSFVLVAVNVGIAAAVHPRTGRAARLLGGVLAAVLAGLVVGYGLLRPDPAVTGTVRVVGVQPGVIDYGERRFAAHIALTRRISGYGQDAVVWGQSSMPFDPARRPDLVTKVRQAAEAVGSDVLVNVDARGTDGRIRKTTHQYGPGGLVGTYEKQRLVPFGEYVPLRPVLGELLSGTAVAAEDRAPGNTLEILRVGGVRVGPLVSYESMFPDMRRELVRRGADLTLVQGSLTSFHRSWAQPQQASAEAVRAVESGRSALLVEMNGPSVAFDPRGRQLEWVPPERRGIFVVDLPLTRETTLYVRWGDWVPVLAGAITALGVIVLVGRALRRPKR